MLGTSKYYKLSAVFSDTTEVRNVHYVDALTFDKDRIIIQGGMLDLTDPVVFYGLRLCNSRCINSERYGDFVPLPVEESIIYFEAVDKITLTKMDGSESTLFENFT